MRKCSWSGNGAWLGARCKALLLSGTRRMALALSWLSPTQPRARESAQTLSNNSNAWKGHRHRR
eukprot:634965-Pyramimonas_sp.AAC.1